MNSLDDSINRLPPNLQEAVQSVLPATIGHEPDSRQLEDSIRLLHAFVDESCKAAEMKLLDIHPDVLLNFETIVASVAQKEGRLLGSAGLTRPLWVLAVASNPNASRSTSAQHLSEYFSSVADAIAGITVSGMMESLVDMHEVSMDIASLPGFDMTYRMWSSHVRFAWITRRLLLDAADIVQSDPTTYAGATEILNRDSVDDVFRFYKKLAMRKGGWTHSRLSEIQPTRPATRELLRTLSMRAGSRSGRSVRNLLTDSDYLKFPFILWKDLCIPAGSRAFWLEGEITILELVDRLCPRGAKGRLFESLVARNVAPNGSDVVSDDVWIGDHDAPRTHEVDGIAVSRHRRAMVVLEAKSYFPPQPSTATANALTKALNDATKQLIRRVNCLESGGTVTSGTRIVEVNPGSSPVRISGAIIVASPYAGGLWLQEVLESSQFSGTTFPAIPLHQAAYLRLLFANFDEWLSYLETRQTFLRSGVKVLDEFDLWLAFKSGLTVPPKTDGKVISMLKTYTLPPDITDALAAPDGELAQELFDRSHPA